MIYAKGVEIMRNIAGILISYVAIGLIIISAKFFEKAGKEATRKFIHIMLCNWWFIAMYFFDNLWSACFVPATFVVINFISYKKDIISVMERDKQDGLGTVYYALSLLLLAIYSFGIVKNPEIGLVSSLVMGYGDGLAAIIGKTVKSYSYKIGNSYKTIAGSITMFIISTMIFSICLSGIGITYWFIKAVVAGALATIVEAISIKGTDNLTIPIVCSVLLTIFL